MPICDGNWLLPTFHMPLAQYLSMATDSDDIVRIIEDHCFIVIRMIFRSLDFYHADPKINTNTGDFNKNFYGCWKSS